MNLSGQLFSDVTQMGHVFYVILTCDYYGSHRGSLFLTGIKFHSQISVKLDSCGKK